MMRVLSLNKFTASITSNDSIPEDPNDDENIKLDITQISYN